MLAYEPSRRISAKAAVSHAYFTDVEVSIPPRLWLCRQFSPTVYIADSVGELERRRWCFQGVRRTTAFISCFKLHTPRVVVLHWSIVRWTMPTGILTCQISQMLHYEETGL